MVCPFYFLIKINTETAYSDPQHGKRMVYLYFFEYRENSNTNSHRKPNADEYEIHNFISLVVVPFNLCI